MKIQQFRTGSTVKGMLEKLREIYLYEKFEEDDEVTMTFGYILNTAFAETEGTNDWEKIINSSVDVEDKYFALVKETETQVTKFRLSEKCSDGIDSLTRLFTKELGFKAQKGFTVKQILKAALIQKQSDFQI